MTTKPRPLDRCLFIEMGSQDMVKHTKYLYEKNNLQRSSVFHMLNCFGDAPVEITGVRCLKSFHFCKLKKLVLTHDSWQSRAWSPTTSAAEIAEMENHQDFKGISICASCKILILDCFLSKQSK